MNLLIKYFFAVQKEKKDDDELVEKEKVGANQAEVEEFQLSFTAFRLHFPSPFLYYN